LNEKCENYFLFYQIKKTIIRALLFQAAHWWVLVSVTFGLGYLARYFIGVRAVNFASIIAVKVLDLLLLLA